LEKATPLPTHLAAVELGSPEITPAGSHLIIVTSARGVKSSFYVLAK